MSSSSSLGDVFTFDTPDDVLRVLASIRASDATMEQKNELRDLVLSYTNGGKDPSVQIQISQMLNSLGVTLVPPKVVESPAPVAQDYDFGSSRSVPTFTPSNKKVTQKTPAPNPQTEVKPQKQDSNEPAQSDEQPVEATVPSENVQTATVPEATIQPNQLQESAAATPVETTQPANVTPAPVTTSAPAPTPTPAQPPVAAPATPPAATSADPAADEALIRIREIKALVNEKVGNPVNLVDIDNVVGREYMSALLDAMKQLNSGNSTKPSMARLENAYQAVEDVLKAREATSPSAADTTPPAPVAPTSPVTSSVPTPTSTSAPAPTPVTPVQPISQATAPVPKPNEAQESTPAHVGTQDISQAEKRWGKDAVVPTPSPEASVPEQNISGPAVQPVASTPAAPVDSTSASVPPNAPAGVQDTPTPAIPTPETPKQRVIKPLSQSAAPLKTINDVPTAASVNSSETGDPLYTKEVTNGLNQLLSDWMLFKKSGLFGTGPKGIEHPLYIKIKDLQIPLLLAGRFEGATQEIKQSVTDYMNGWRYEQGIIYEQGEVFDHYLRRVIRHILDLQK